MDTWREVGKVYICYVEDIGIFNGLRISIESIEGEHLSEKLTNEDVTAISIELISNLGFLPENINEHFGNIKAIRVHSSQLQEINQSDLIAFPQLEYLNLQSNKISILEKDLFKFNPKLKLVSFVSNPIYFIDLNVFSELHNLEALYLGDSKCRNTLVNADERKEVLKLVKVIEGGDCVAIENIFEFVKDLRSADQQMTENITNLEVANKNLTKYVENLYEELNFNATSMIANSDKLMSEKFDKINKIIILIGSTTIGFLIFMNFLWIRLWLNAKKARTEQSMANNVIYEDVRYSNKLND